MFSRIVSGFLELDPTHYGQLATFCEVIPGSVKRWAAGDACPLAGMRLQAVNWISDRLLEAELAEMTPAQKLERRKLNRMFDRDAALATLMNHIPNLQKCMDGGYTDLHARLLDVTRAAQEALRLSDRYEELDFLSREVGTDE